MAQNYCFLRNIHLNSLKIDLLNADDLYSDRVALLHRGGVRHSIFIIFMKIGFLCFVCILFQFDLQGQPKKRVTLEFQSGLTSLKYLDPLWKPLSHFGSMFDPEIKGSMQLNMLFNMNKVLSYGFYINNATYASTRKTLSSGIVESSSIGKMSFIGSGLKVNLNILNLKQHSFGLAFSHSIWLSKVNEKVTMVYHGDSAVPGKMFASPESIVNLGLRYAYKFKDRNFELSSELFVSRFKFSYPGSICKGCPDPYPVGGGWHPYGSYLNLNIGVNYNFVKCKSCSK